ncbi:MAG: SDR family NAD(P)-dependent oxidoreductase [Burkholderiaceae bacterium]
MRLAGRRIVVSGAASGIGRATAELFRSEGAAVALFDRDENGLDAALAAMRSVPGPALAGFTVDVTDRAALEVAVQAAAKAMSGIDGLVGAAGIDCLAPFGQMSVEQWQRVLDVNLSGPFHLSQSVLPYLCEAASATIVHIASGAALRPLAARTAYCAAKAGLVMFAKTLAIDLAESGIRVNAICPGIIDTPLFRQSLEAAADPSAELDKVLDRYLIRRIGRPLDIANAALFLSCDESAHVTGSALAVDGGRTFH